MDEDKPTDEQELKPDRIPIEEFDKMRMPLIVRFIYEMGLVFTTMALTLHALAVLRGIFLIIRQRGCHNVQ